MENSLNKDQALQETIKTEIAKYNIADAAIAQLAEKYAGLQFTSLKDKANVKEIKEAYSSVKKYRTGIEDKRKDLKKEYLETGRAIDAEAKRLTEKLLDIENPLADEYKKIKDAEEAKKIAKEEERKQALLKRVETLEEAGLSFDGSFYSLGNISLDISTIEQLPQEAFENLLSRVSEEKSRIEREEQERIKAQQEKEEQERREAEQREQERIKHEEEKAEMIRMRIESRGEYMANLGFTIVKDEFFAIEIGTARIFHKLKDIGEMDLSTWNDFKVTVHREVETAKIELEKEQEEQRQKEIKAQQEKEEQERIKKEKEEQEKKKRFELEEKENKANSVLYSRSKELEQRGLIFSLSLNGFLFTNEIGSVQIDVDKVKYTTDEEYKIIFDNSVSKIEDLKTQQIEAESERAKVEEETKQRAEQERLAKMGDSEKVADYFKTIENAIYKAPTLQLQETDDMLKRLNSFILDQLQKFTNKIN